MQYCKIYKTYQIAAAYFDSCYFDPYFVPYSASFADIADYLFGTENKVEDFPYVFQPIR